MGVAPSLYLSSHTNLSVAELPDISSVMEPDDFTAAAQVIHESMSPALIPPRETAKRVVLGVL